MQKTGLWTPQEDQKMRELFAKGMTAAQVGAQLGRSKDSVQSRKSKIGLSSAEVFTAKPPVQAAQPSNTDATYTEIQYPSGLAQQMHGAPGRNLIQMLQANGVSVIGHEAHRNLLKLWSKDQTVIDNAKTLVMAMFEQPKAGDVFEATVIMVRPYGTFVNLKPFYAGMLPDVKGELKVGDKLDVKVTEVTDAGHIGLEVAQKAEEIVQALVPKKYTVDELVDHLNGMSKIISAKIGQQVVLAAYVIAD